MKISMGYPVTTHNKASKHLLTNPIISEMISTVVCDVNHTIK